MLVEPVHAALEDPDRVEAVERACEVAGGWGTGLQRLTDMAARLLQVEYAFLSLVGPEREVIAAMVDPKGGVPSDLPVEQSVCLLLVESGTSLLVPDLVEHPLLKHRVEVQALGLRSYAGAPITTAEGLVLGGFCVGSLTPREWTGADAELLADLAAAATTELHLRVALGDVSRLERVERGRAEEQAALHRVAASVARGSPVDDVLAEVTAELAGLRGTEVALVLRFERDGRAEVAARTPLAGPLADLDVTHVGHALAKVRGTGEPAVGEEDDVPCAVAPIAGGDHTWGAVVLCTDTTATARDALTTLEQLAAFITLVVANAAAREQLEALARTDALTGVGNRRAFDEGLDRELQRCVRHAHPLMLALMDIDHFKRINDEHGHAVGDRVLRELTGRVRQHLRAGDLIARVGGDEIAVLLPETSTASSTHVLDRIVRAVADVPLAGLSVTMTIGAAVVQDGQATAQALYRAADTALYRAKESDRGSISILPVE